jgi:serine/threonine protein kinase
MSPELFGKFELLQEVGRGGMGVVFRARDTTLGREVALKLLQGLSDPDAVARFQREAQLAARLRHPGIVTIYEAGVEKGVPYIAMEFVRGTGLDVLLAGPMRARERVEILRRVAETVHAAHEQGIIHRDLKPSNIIVDEAGRPHVADFGIARDARGTALTATGMMVGSPPYMAPEQARGESSLVDRRTDVYALGVILYEAVARRRPFEASDVPRLLAMIAEDEPAPPSRLQPSADARLDRICLKALAKDRDSRYATARSLAEDLTRWLAGQPVIAERPPLTARLAMIARRHPTLIAAAVAAALAGTGVWLAVAPRTARFSWTCTPAGARVEIDGREVTRSPLDLAPGTHHIRASLAGRRTVEESIDMRGGEAIVRRSPRSR